MKGLFFCQLCILRKITLVLLKKLSIYILLLFLCTQCTNSDQTQIESKFTRSIPTDIPKNIQFGHILFDYTFDNVPEDGNPDEYKRENSVNETFYFAISNEREFGPSYQFEISKDWQNDYINVEFDVSKPSGYEPDPLNHQGFLVISAERDGLDSFVIYKSFPIQELLKTTNRQMVDVWQRMTVWYQIPPAIQIGDQLKFYIWNPSAGNIHIDNFKATHWPKKLDLSDYGISHSVYENNYEDERMKNATTEKAARGIRSVVISTENQFGKGFSNTIMGMNAEQGDYIHVSLRALKYHHSLNDKSTAKLVYTIRNAEYFYQTFSVDTRIWSEGEQLLDTWKKIDYWFKIPKQVNERDKIEIYTYNPNNTPVFIDDIKIDVWKPNVNL